jgi:(2Fe-2S) ferredoxin
MTYFKYHAFFCLNERVNGEDCCALHDAKNLFDYAKSKCKELGLNGAGNVRVNKAGCLDRCEHGPVMVVYPDAIWYTMVDTSDIDEIVASHFEKGIPVKRLMIE